MCCVNESCCWALKDTRILDLRSRGTPSGASDLAPSLALERDTLFSKAVCKNSVTACTMGRNMRASWRMVSEQLPKAYKISSLITGKMLRHLCSVDYECRPALNLQEVMPWEQEVVINSEKKKIQTSHSKKKYIYIYVYNSHFSLEKRLSTKMSKYTTLHEMGFFSLDALQQTAYK